MANDDRISTVRVKDLPLWDQLEDSRAEQESRGLSEGSLRAEAEKNQHGRDERFKTALHVAGLGILLLVVSAFVVMGGVWLWHLLTTSCHHWLTEEQLETIQTIVFSSVAAITASSYARRYME